MCGIAGFYWLNEPANAAVLRSMCDEIRHRGPDDDGIHIEATCGIGMRRLSIIDLSTGHQPIANEDETIWIVFNGEIYNFQALRAELIRKGHRFRTNSDTETIIHLYEEEGPAGVSRLRGMFAFAIWDAKRRRLFIARDRFGKKPLYYAVTRRGLVFGSELKCLRAAGVELETDETALKLYFRFSCIPDPFTAYQDVKKLPPGCLLLYDGGSSVSIERYWSLPEPAAVRPHDLTYEDARTRVRELFDESVAIRMIADVPLGAFLSGGIDSSLVVASMAAQSREPVKTFSIGFEDQRFNELEYARAVADQYRTEHHEIIVKPDALAIINRIVDHFDEPFGDSSAIPTLIVSEQTARHVKVALSGDGGDELFAGYESFFWMDKLRRADHIPRLARSAMSAAAALLPYSAPGKNYLRMLSRPTPMARYFELNYAHYFLRESLLEPRWMMPDDVEWLRGAMPHNFIDSEADILSQVMYWEATAKLSADMLVKVDRMSMAASLEVRCPLLDHELAALAMRIPHEWKMRHGQGKFILLDAMRDRLPEQVWNRPKQGFAVPLVNWFRTSLRDFLHDHLDSSRFFSRGIVRPEFVRYLLREHDSGRRNNAHWLFNLLMLELWFRRSEERAAAAGIEAAGAPLLMSHRPK